VPPLRDRKDDIPALAVEFARRYGDRFGLGAVSLEPALIDALVRADWPGNVRQLENTIARLAALSAGGVIGLADYQSATGESPTAAPAAVFEAHDAGDEHNNGTAIDARNGPSLKEQVEAFERGLVGRALEATGGNQSEAARRLGVSRVTLIDKMKKYGLASKR
jgi:two-component system response regulator AtoC